MPVYLSLSVCCDAVVGLISVTVSPVCFMSGNCSDICSCCVYLGLCMYMYNHDYGFTYYMYIYIYIYILYVKHDL